MRSSQAYHLHGGLSTDGRRETLSPEQQRSHTHSGGEGPGWHFPETAGSWTSRMWGTARDEGGHPLRRRYKPCGPGQASGRGEQGAGGTRLHHTIKVRKPGPRMPRGGEESQRQSGSSSRKTLEGSVGASETQSPPPFLPQGGLAALSSSAKLSSKIKVGKLRHRPDRTKLWALEQLGASAGAMLGRHGEPGRVERPRPRKNPDTASPVLSLQRNLARSRENEKQPFLFVF